MGAFESDGSGRPTAGRRRLIACLLAAGVALLLLVAGCGSDDDEDSGSAAQSTGSAEGEPEQTSFKLGHSAVDPALLPEKIAVEQGLFEKYGLDVEMIEFDGDTKAAQALQSGAIDGVSAGGTIALSAGRTPRPNVVVATMLSEPTDMLVGVSDVKTGEDLKGKQIAVSQIGGESQASVLLALKELGVSPDDVTITQVGGESDRIAALAAGSVDAAPVDQFLESEMNEQGFNKLVTLSETGLRTARHGVQIPQEYLDENPNTVRAIVAGILEGAQMMHEDADLRTKTWADWSQVEPAEAEEQLAISMPTLESQRCLRSEQEWWDTLKDIMSEVDESLAEVDTTKIWTNDFVDGLVEDGTAAEVGASC
jgi:NitT/TauT family transport system substrate-binding protein